MGVKGALLRYRVMAYVTGVVLATAFIWLIVGRLFLDYVDPEARPAQLCRGPSRPRSHQPHRS